MKREDSNNDLRSGQLHFDGPHLGRHFTDERSLDRQQDEPGREHLRLDVGSDPTGYR